MATTTPPLVAINHFAQCFNGSDITAEDTVHRIRHKCYVGWVKLHVGVSIIKSGNLPSSDVCDSFCTQVPIFGIYIIIELTLMAMKSSPAPWQLMQQVQTSPLW